MVAFFAVLSLTFNAIKTNASIGPAYVAMAAIVVQFLLGITTLLHGVPVPLGGLHQAGAVILLGSVIWLSHGLTRTR